MPKFVIDTVPLFLSEGIDEVSLMAFIDYLSEKGDVEKADWYSSFLEILRKGGKNVQAELNSLATPFHALAEQKRTNQHGRWVCTTKAFCFDAVVSRTNGYFTDGKFVCTLDKTETRRAAKLRGATHDENTGREWKPADIMHFWREGEKAKTPVIPVESDDSQITFLSKTDKSRWTCSLAWFGMLLRRYPMAQWRTRGENILAAFDKDSLQAILAVY